MYLEHWGLAKAPFGNVPSREIFFRSPQHEEALRRLLYAIEYHKGVAMLTGEVGCGKTTITKALKCYLNKDLFQLKTISNPALQPTDLIKAILIKLGDNLENTNGSKTVLLDRLQKLLFQNAQQGVSTVLAVDEAHVIGNRATLDELRMLLNMQHDDEFLITLILLGQPPLLKNITELQPLKERISIMFNLDPLDSKDTLRYVLFRLKSAGASRGIFSKEAIGLIYEYSGGIPLRTNNLCDRCLLIGLMRKAKIIDSKIVEDAIEDLGS
ncbi:MAG: AAA family ATPase [Desulfobacterales bacterium]|nr:MAG: AAA family ATPase [Desulfobacterales bacterium]